MRDLMKHDRLVDDKAAGLISKERAGDLLVAGILIG
jgi:hypothetical protein